MKSSIRIDFIDRGTGKGIEPVIKVEIKSSDDPRDTLISHLFQSLHGQSYLQLSYTNHKHVVTEDSLPDMEKTVVLFKPEICTTKKDSIVKMAFHKWCLVKGWSAIIVSTNSLAETVYSNKKKQQDTKTESELFSQFLIEEAVHSN